MTSSGALAIDGADREALFAAGHALADIARSTTLPFFRWPGLVTDNKAEHGFDPVTEADRAAEDAMRSLLRERRPMDGIVGEERGAQAGRSGLTWVIDPIDGTRGFLSGTPTWGVLIAVCDGLRPIYGLIDQPFIGERFEGGLGRASYAGPHGSCGLRCRTGMPLERAVLMSTFPEVGTAAEAAAFRAVAERVRLVRYGTDCYAYALLAMGQVDLVIEAGLQRYDVAAPIAVIEAAGGVVTDWQGGPADEGGRVLAAGSRELHGQALEILQDFGDRT